MSYDTTFGYSAIQSKLWQSFRACITQIQEGKRVILFARDYVMISRNVYDKMIQEQYPEKFEGRYFDEMDNWLRDRFLKGDK